MRNLSRPTSSSGWSRARARWRGAHERLSAVGRSDAPREIMDLTSRLRSIVRPPNAPPRELTYEPDTGRYEATIDLDRVADVLGGRTVSNGFGRALVVDRRYESERFHGTRRVGSCAVADGDALRLLDPGLAPRTILDAAEYEEP